MTLPSPNTGKELSTEAAKELSEELYKLSNSSKPEDQERYVSLTKGLIEHHPEESKLFDRVYHYNEEWPHKEDWQNSTRISSQEVNTEEPYPFDVVGRRDGGEKLHAIKMKFGLESRLDKKQVVPFYNLTVDDREDPEVFSEGKFIATFPLKGTLTGFKEAVEEEPDKKIIYDDDGIAWLKKFSTQVIEDLKSSTDITEISTPDTLKLYPWQKEAVDKVTDALRQGGGIAGRLTMPFGTGKTVVSLRIAEELIPENGHILYLVPFVALMDQTMREWLHRGVIPKALFAVGSDETTGKDRITGNNEEPEKPEVIGVKSISDLPITVTTDVADIIKEFSDFKKWKQKQEKAIPHVTFCTYESLNRIVEAQENGVPAFDLVIADEAHHTIGVEKRVGNLSENDEYEGLTLVTNSNKLHAARRLYMTATPRQFTESTEPSLDYGLFSMNDKRYGKEFYHMNFGDAVDAEALTKYKVLIVLHNKYPDTASAVFGEPKNEKEARENAKLIALWNVLANPKSDNPEFNRLPGIKTADALSRVITYSNTINISKRVAKKLEKLAEHFSKSNAADNFLQLSVKHVDGWMPAYTRRELIDWLKTGNDPATTILSNARCLTEGVDVPDLDAISFLNSKISEIDIIQAVSHVMRKAPNKGLGYIILPVLVDDFYNSEDIEKIAEGISNGSDFKLVWSTLRALRAHDKALETKINLGNINNIEEITVLNHTKNQELASMVSEQLERSVKSRAGDALYWEQWAKEIGTYIGNIADQINHEIIVSPGFKAKYDEFLEAMRSTLNTDLSETDFTRMLAQHVATLPIFDALFDDSFVQHNLIAKTMDTMLATLDGISNTNLPERQNERLTRFYTYIESRLNRIKENDEGRLNIVLEFHETLFKTALSEDMKGRPALAYETTPDEMIDFLIRSVDDLCKTNFGLGLTNEGVHILEPFVGTGTFLNRLLNITTNPDDNKSYIIEKDDLTRKFTQELHANETLLLTHYLASVIIEEGYRDREPSERFTFFEGLTLTDVFQPNSSLQNNVSELRIGSSIGLNNQRVLRQTNHEMQVIIGTVRSTRGTSYPELEDHVKEIYGRKTKDVMSLHWVSDKINSKTGGIVGLVFPNEIIDNKSMRGVRARIAKDFTSAWIYDLRGASILRIDTSSTSRTDARKREGDNPFSSAKGVCLLILINDPKRKDEEFCVYHKVVEPYANLVKKLNNIETTQATSKNPEHWQKSYPDENSDWINQDKQSFKEKHIPIIGKKVTGSPTETIFSSYAHGIATSKNAKFYGYDYNSFPARIISELNSADEFDPARIQKAHYRPFVKTYLYFDPSLISSPSTISSIFPEDNLSNTAITLQGVTKFSFLAVDSIPDRGNYTTKEVIPRFIYQNESSEKTDNITNGILEYFQTYYEDTSINKDDIWYYTYGALHAQNWRTRYANELTKNLPHIPMAEGSGDFRKFCDAGKALIALHINYETIDPYPLEVRINGVVYKGETLTTNTCSNPNVYRIEDKMRLKKLLGNRTNNAKIENQAILEINKQFQIIGIPDLAANPDKDSSLHLQPYLVSGLTPLQWAVNQLRVITDRRSGVIDDANQWHVWQTDQNAHKLVLHLLRLVRVSVETSEIVAKLPAMPLVSN